MKLRKYDSFYRIFIFLFLNLNLFKITTQNDLTGIDVDKLPKIEDLYSPSPYILEKYCKVGETTLSIKINPWRAAIFEFGYFNNGSLEMLRRKKSVHKCMVRIITDDDFRLVASVEHLSMRGNLDRINHKWICQDYIRFSSPGRNLASKILKYVLDVNVLNEKQSSKLCGSSKLDGSVLVDNVRILDETTDANSFHTGSKRMDFRFHQDDDKAQPFNNTFRIVVTSFRHTKEKDVCEGKQICYGRNNYCIDKGFVCDGHVNCAFPGSGTDEKLCSTLSPYGKKKASEENTFNVTKVIIICLVAIIGLGIAVCVISTLACKIKSTLYARRAWNDRRRACGNEFHSGNDYGFPGTTVIDSDLVVNFDGSTSVGARQRSSTLPGYEAVILSDQQEEALKREAIEMQDLPPKYDSLFPDGPPQTKEAKPEGEPAIATTTTS